MGLKSRNAFGRTWTSGMVADHLVIRNKRVRTLAGLRSDGHIANYGAFRAGALILGRA
jgi:hypothetical protein